MIFPLNIASNLQGAISSLLRPFTTDADGKFEITSIQPGAYSLSASSPGYVTSYEDSKVIYRPGDTATLTLVKGRVITGRVTNSSGEPVIGALVKAIKIREANSKPVRAQSGIGAQFTNGMEMMLGPFKTDDRGIYRIYGLSPDFIRFRQAGRADRGSRSAGVTPTRAMRRRTSRQGRSRRPPRSPCSPGKKRRISTFVIGE